MVVLLGGNEILANRTCDFYSVLEGPLLEEGVTAAVQAAGFRPVVLLIRVGAVWIVVGECPRMPLKNSANILPPTCGNIVVTSMTH